MVDVHKFLRTNKEFWTRQRKTSPCKCDHRFMEKILESMGLTAQEISDAVDVVKSYGGFCDCEVMLNSMERLVDPKLEDALLSEWYQHDFNEILGLAKSPLRHRVETMVKWYYRDGLDDLINEINTIETAQELPLSNVPTPACEKEIKKTIQEITNTILTFPRETVATLLLGYE